TIDSSDSNAGAYQIRFAPIQYDSSGNSTLVDKANLCALPLASFDLSPQFSHHSISSPSHPNLPYLYGASNPTNSTSTLRVQFEPAAGLYETSSSNSSPMLATDMSTHSGTLPKQTAKSSK